MVALGRQGPRTRRSMDTEEPRCAYKETVCNVCFLTRYFLGAYTNDDLLDRSHFAICKVFLRDREIGRVHASNLYTEKRHGGQQGTVETQCELFRAETAIPPTLGRQSE